MRPRNNILRLALNTTIVLEMPLNYVHQVSTGCKVYVNTVHAYSTELPITHQGDFETLVSSVHQKLKCPTQRGGCRYTAWPWNRSRIYTGSGDSLKATLKYGRGEHIRVQYVQSSVARIHLPAGPKSVRHVYNTVLPITHSPRGPWNAVQFCTSKTKMPDTRGRLHIHGMTMEAWSDICRGRRLLKCDRQNKPRHKLEAADTRHDHGIVVGYIQGAATL